MSVERFSLAALATMDGGRIAEAFAQALQRCELDCEDRPGCKDARSVKLSLSVTPVVGEKGELDSVDVELHITDSVPKRKSKVYNMSARDGQLYFNDLAPENARQGTLDDAGSGAALGPRRVADAR